MLHSRLPLAAIAIIAPFMLEGQTFSYVPVTSSYVMVVKSNGTSEVAGRKRDVALDARQRLTLTLASRAPDTLALTIVLDSAVISAPSFGVVDAAPAIGLTVTALLSPRGEIYSRALPDLTGREAFMPVAEEMARFLPVMPRALRAGLSWSDTTKDTVSQLGIPIARTRITDYAVYGDTTLAGERAWRIDRRARATFDGTGASMGAPVVFLGTATGTGAYFISRSGRYLGADLREDVQSRVTLSTLGQEIVGSQVQTTSIRLAP